MTAARMAAALALGLLSVAGLPAAVTPTAASAATATPDAAARTFYGWYIGLMTHDKEPSDDAAGYARYVTAALRGQIKRQMDGPDGMDVDYFTKAQDYDEDWPGHVSATKPTMAGATARTVVTLGADARHPYRLAVTLRRENNAWKVARVVKA